MPNSFGPWATPINAGMNPQLSSFWKRRLKMLVPASQAAPGLSWRNLLGLCVLAALMIVLPTVRTISAAADEEKPKEIPNKISQANVKEDKTSSKEQKPIDQPPKTDEVKKPQKPSPAAQAAAEAYKANWAAYETGFADLEAVYRWSCRWMQAERTEKGEAAIKAHLERMEDLYKKIKSLNDAGGKVGDAASLAAARYYVVEAEDMLQEAQKTPGDQNRTSAVENSAAAAAARDAALRFLQKKQGASAKKSDAAAVGDIESEKQSLDEFKRLYALKDGECLKRVPPPFSSARLQYYRSTNPGQAESIPRGPDAMWLRWQDGKLKNWSMTFGSMDLYSLQNNLAGIYPQEIEGDAELLKSPIQGDWVVRVGTPKKEILARLEEILNSECKLPVKLSLRTVERKVFVAKGKFHVQPSQNESGEYGPCVKIYGRKYSLDAHGGGSGNLDKFLKFVGGFTNRRVVGEVENPPREDFVWFDHGDHFPTKKEEIEDRDPAVVLKNLTEQTGLTFTEETRSVSVLFVERKE